MWYRYHKIKCFIPWNKNLVILSTSNIHNMNNIIQISVKNKHARELKWERQWSNVFVMQWHYLQTDWFLFFSKCIKKHHVTDQYFRLHKHSFFKIMYTSIILILICSVNKCFHYSTMHLCLILALWHCKLWFTKLIMSKDPHKISISVSPVIYINKYT